RKIAMSEEFISKFPNSDLVPTAQMIRFVSYSQVQKHKEAVAAGEQAIDATVKLGEKLVAKAEADSKLTEKEKNDVKKKDKNAIFIDKNSPVFQQFMSTADKQILAIYKQIIQEYQALADMPKAFEWGEKAIGYKPDDVDTLATVAYLMAERPPTVGASKPATTTTTTSGSVGGTGVNLTSTTTGSGFTVTQKDFDDNMKPAEEIVN